MKSSRDLLHSIREWWPDTSAPHGDPNVVVLSITFLGLQPIPFGPMRRRVGGIRAGGYRWCRTCYDKGLNERSQARFRSMAASTPLFICSTGHNMRGRLAFLAFDGNATKCTLASRSYFAGRLASMSRSGILAGIVLSFTWVDLVDLFG